MSIFAAHSQNNDPRLDSASEYIDASNYGKAINIYSGILSADTKNARVYELRRYVYGQMKDYECALKDYTFPIRADEHYWLAYLRRAKSGRAYALSD